MDNKYITLFREIARSVETMAERVMELNRQNKDEKGEKTAQIMRNDYAALYDKMRQENFNPDTISRVEWIKILAGAMIIVNNIESQIAGQKKALQGYKIDLLPKLNRIMNETKTDEEANSLANEIFKISESK